MARQNHEDYLVRFLMDIQFPIRKPIIEKEPNKWEFGEFDLSYQKLLKAICMTIESSGLSHREVAVQCQAIFKHSALHTIPISYALDCYCSIKPSHTFIFVICRRVLLFAQSILNINTPCQAGIYYIFEQKIQESCYILINILHYKISCAIISQEGGDMMTVSARIQEGLLALLSDNCPHSVQEIKLYLSQIGIPNYSEGQFAGSINTLLRNKTIIKVDRAIYTLNQKAKGGLNFMKYCFVVSPIGEDGSETRDNADKLFKHIISPVCQYCNFTVERVDRINDFNSITQTIIDKLQSADLVIADISEHNPNVFYEMGYRKCTGKPIIHLKRKNEHIPFDINTIRTFEYDLTDLDHVEATKERLQQTISAFSFDDSSNREDSDKPQSENLTSILSVLYQIQDSITELKEEISKKDMETIQTIMQTSLNNAAKEESPDTIMLKALFPELLKNPQAFANLMQIADMANKSKK